MTTVPRPAGASASSIWSHLTGQGKQNGDYPHDADDFGRCEAFLQSQPQLRAEFPRMAEVNDYWRFLLTSWDVIAMRPKTERTGLIRAIIDPLEKVDPSCGKMPGIGVTIRIGPITFKLLDDAPARPPAPPQRPDEDAIFNQAVQLVWEHKNGSTSFLQRRLNIGYNAAARLVERMEGLGILSAPDHVGKRDVRMPDDLRAAMNIRDTIEAIAGPEHAATVVAAISEALKENTPMSKPGHNSGDDPYAVTADELRQFIERAEQLAAEKKDIAEQEKELFAEAKGRGYDTKVMRKVIALRKRKPDEIAEEEAVLELYKSALGMA